MSVAERVKGKKVGKPGAKRPCARTPGAKTHVAAHPEEWGTQYHTCVFYSTTGELSQICLDLAEKEAAAGKRCLFVLDESVRLALARDLARKAPANHQITSAEELFGYRSSLISVEAVSAQLKARAAAAVSEGSSGLLVLIDMSWMVDTPSGLANHGELEAQLHELGNVAPISIACFFNKMIFPANILLDALQTHALIYDEGQIWANPHFLPPDVFLSGDPQLKVDWWLSSMHEPLAPAAQRPARPAAIRAPKPSYAARAVKKKPPTLPSISGIALPSKINQDMKLSHADTAKRWKVRCLGELRIYPRDGKQIQWNRCSGATYKTKTLFAYLFQRGSAGATAEEAADLLWPEASDVSQSLNRLYHTVHCLRMALSPELTSSRNSPYVVSRNGRYFLALPEETWVDVPVFEQFCRQGEMLLRAGDLDQALICHMAAERLYTGKLFDDIPATYVENPEQDWCWSNRFWLEEMYVKMLTDLASIHRLRKDLKTALRYCNQALKTDPCLENAHREAMRIYHLKGRPDALSRQFRMCRESLKRFEDRPPSAETTELAQNLIV